ICAQVSNGGRGCQAGTCVITGCNPGWSNCDGQYGTGCETNTQVDVNNCGNCGVICTGGDVCSFGECVPA
ncbi:MAG TPA: hypothetical protein VEV82_01980, partial [Actinomycetota bacterium]|nr:hypothetical protein [Actinomycetota bacterium]